jgi:hypothetical protein
MKLLVTAEIPADEQITNYSFCLGVRYRHRPGDFDSSGFCSHTVAEDAGNEMRFGCGVDCDGGGIDVALSKDDKSAVIRLGRVRIWQNNKPDEEAGDSLVAGADDKIFRLDRTDTRECASLVTDRKELAAIRFSKGYRLAKRRANMEDAAMHRRRILWGAFSALGAAFASAATSRTRPLM